MNQWQVLMAKANSILGCVRNGFASGWREVILHFHSGHLWSAVSSTGLPRTQKTWTYRSKSSKELQRQLREGSI